VIVSFMRSPTENERDTPFTIWLEERTRWNSHVHPTYDQARA
jgi:hypothetical protein